MISLPPGGKIGLVLPTAIAVVFGVGAWGQTPAPRVQVSGTIASVDANGGHLALKGDKGEDVTVNTTARTLLLRMPPGETDPKKGAKIALTDISAGDRAV